MRRKKVKILNLRFNWVERIFLSVVIVLSLLVFVFFKIYTASTEKSQIDLICTFMDKMSENQKMQFETYVDEKVQILKSLVTYPEIYEMNNEAQRTFLENRADALGFQYFFVMNPNGTGYYIDENIYRSQKQEAFFTDVMNNDVFITEPYFRGDGSAIMTVCASIYDEKNNKVGVLCGAVNLDSVQQVIASNEMILDGACFILNELGNYVTVPENIAIYDRKCIYETPDSDLSLIEDAFSGKCDKEGTIVLDGAEYQANITYLENYKWLIVHCIPTASILKSFEGFNYIQYIVLFLVVLMIFCIGRISYCWAKSDRKVYTDALTKGFNRAACFRVLEYLEKRKKYDITIVYMDLNKFKLVNDTYGHDKGDELLCIFSDALVQVFGEEGFVGRMGGDEFISVILNITESEIRELWMQLDKMLSEKSKTLDFPYQITSAYGCATRKKNETESLNLVMQKADQYMYENKAKSEQISL